MNTNFYSLWFDPTGNRTRVYRFSSRRSIHSTTDRLYVLRYLRHLNLFHTVICLKIPFHPNQPTFGRDEVFSFFFPLFFFLNFVRSSCPKPQNNEIYFLCKVVELQRQFFLPKFFWATPPGTPHNGAPKINFLNGSS